MFHVKTDRLSEPVVRALESLCGRYGLDAGQQERLAAMLAYLGSAGRAAPTTVWEPERALPVHLADSLVALEFAEVRTAATLADLGAGAGFPGLPLGAALPGSEVRLVESQQRKCEFIERLRVAAGIDNARVICGRVEDWGEGFEVHDVVLARAVAPLPVVVEYAAPLLRIGGRLVAWRGSRSAEEEQAAAVAASCLGMRPQAVRLVQPYTEVRAHHLHTYLKVAPTPAGFPRRAGIARKRPLGC